MHLVLDDIGRDMDFSGIAEKEIILELVYDVLFNAQRIYHHIVASVEFNKIETSKGSRILVLVSSVNL